LCVSLDFLLGLERALKNALGNLATIVRTFALIGEAGLQPDRYHVGFGARPGR